ncbi:MAG: SDR family NAD(P)-dependent oxidoreductase [Muribaculaceae bacterium]|nr:SDR family NAD(P)-dependent oxidoreductase [Muribaculaceae bacterium]
MKTIIIIGASSGIGRLIAEDFAGRGWRVGVTARREDALREIAARFPGMVEYSAYDVAADDAGERLSELIERLGGMDVLLFAAGCGWYNPSLDIADEQRTIATNVVGFTRTIDTAYHYFADRGAGHIAAITSIGGVKGLGISPAYSATKRYQWTYIQALDQHAHINGVRITFTDIRPGFIDTALLDRNPKLPPLTMRPVYAVKRIVRAIIKGRRVAVVDWRWRIVAAMWNLIPGSLWRRLKIK